MIPRWLWALFFIALTSPFWNLGHPLIEVDDARYAEIPREMVESGDWGTPHLNGLNYVEKPPLWYWLAAASYKIFSVSEAAARFPLAMLSLLGALGVAWLGSWLYSPRTGIIAAIALLSSALYFFLSHYITPDMGVTVFLLWTSAMILRALLRPHDAWWAGPAAWAFAGLAFLSKGLIALVFPVGWTVACLILFPSFRRGARGLLNPLGPILLIAIAAPWPLLMEHRHPGFLRFFFLEQQFQRFLTPKYNRTEPWYFFLLVLPATLLPWTPAVFSGAAAAAKENRGGDPRAAALGLWAVMITVFFSTSNSKLATYILPVFPHLCLLGAHALEERQKHRLALRLGAAGLALGALVLLGGMKFYDKVSARSLSEAINARYEPGDQIYSYGTYLHAVPFYTRHRVDRVINWVGELHYAQRDPANAGRFGDDDEIRNLPEGTGNVFVILRSREDQYFMSLINPQRIKSRGHFGNWTLIQL